MKKVLIIFDLDDTLLSYRKPVLKVPKQTYHMLQKFKKLNIDMAICSYNPLTEDLVSKHNLFPYIHELSYGQVPREDLVYTIVCKRGFYDFIFYVDDKEENIKRIEEIFPRIQTLLCK